MNLTENLLIIPDVHQNISWVQNILEKERGNFSRVIFLGDWFDTFVEHKRASAGETAKFMMDFKRENPDTIFIVGNHDLHYYENLKSLKEKKSPKFIRHCCSGYSERRGFLLAEYIEENFVKNCKIVFYINGFLFSHGGILPHIFPFSLDLRQSVDILLSQAERAWSDFRFFPDDPMFRPGWAVGGMTSPGPIWTNFTEEFSDGLPIPQIVGHTGANLSPRRKGNSWCLDGNQTCYGVLSKEGNLKIKFLLDDKNLETVLEQQYK